MRTKKYTTYRKFQQNIIKIQKDVYNWLTCYNYTVGIVAATETGIGPFISDPITIMILEHALLQHDLK